MEIVLTKDNFESEVINSNKPVMVDFWATWCGPCRMIAPVVEQIANENDNIKVGKVNVDEQMELAIKYKIDAIPAILFFKNGELVKKSVGFSEKNELLQIINTL